jgi:hypothetical protein
MRDPPPASRPSKVRRLLVVGSTVLVPVALIVLVIALVTGCSERIVEQQAPLGGSCLACHDGITDIHPYFALSCTDCHGGDDAVVIADTVVNVRDQALLKASHVLPLDAEMWWPNGIDDNGDGRIDEQGEFFDGRVVDQDGNSGLAEGRLAPRFELDSEMNRDMNYLRFLNPGDLRIAEVGCGARNRNANPAMVCHAEVVYDMRRSVMATNAGVTSGALFGNAQLPSALDYGADFAGSAAGTRFDQRNPRLGRAAYTFDYDSIDSAYLPAANAFDREALLAVSNANKDPKDDLFEATAGPLFDDGQAKDPFGNLLDPGPGLTRTGNALQFFDDDADGGDGFGDNRAVEVLQNVGNQAFRAFPPQGSALELRLQRILEGLGIQRVSPIRNAIANDGDPLTNPVDAALRTFRAYHILNTYSPSDNFGFKDFFTSPNENDAPPNDATDVELRNNNDPFGRFSSTGCTACHVEYRRDGHNEEPIDRTVADNGRQVETALPFGVRQDLGQRGYARRHEIKKAVQIQTCAACHGFVTRVDYALEGKFELETDFTNLEQVQTIGPFTFATEKTACINVFDNLAHYKNGNLINDGEGVSEDLNNNGELDPGEDANNNTCLDMPDRVRRSDSFDGRQSKLIYGGGNGSTHLQDVHVEAGMGCSDCHVTSAHGDSNMYTRNWDAEPMECEDCHGTPYDEATLVSSGPNGGDDFTLAVWQTPFGKPWFERRGDVVIEHSRQTPGLEFVVPQLVDEREGDAKTGNAKYAHEQPFETGPDEGRDDEARAFAHIQEEGKPGGLECYACHSSWQPNCLSCHLKMDVTTPRQEIWWGDDDVEDIFFQLFSYTRSPFYMGRAGDVEGNKIAPHRSTMQVHLTVTAGGETLLDNAMVATAENLSSLVSNPYFPHTVRTTETKSCARCHTLKLEVNNALAIANDHFITETTAQGTGRYMNIGDWALVATSNAFQQIDLKKEKVGRANVFPGFDFDDANFRQVEFPAGGGLATFDVTLLRGVSFQNGNSDIADVAIIAHETGVSMIDVTGRDNAGLLPTEIARVDSLGPVRSVDVVDAAASQTMTFIAVTDEELCTIDFRAALLRDTVAPIVDVDAGQAGDVFEAEDAGVDGFLQGTRIVDCVPHGKDAVTKVRLHGRFAVVTHSGGISVFALAQGELTAVDLGAPLAEVAELETAHPALDVATSGRFAYVATGEGGVDIFDIGPAVYPLFVEGGAPGDGSEPLSTEPVATALTDLAQEADTRGVAVFGSRLLVADGKNGLRILDVAVPADPRLERTILVVDGEPPMDQATAVVAASVPTRNFAIIADGAHGVRAVNITPARDYREQLKAAVDDPDAFRGLRLSMERWDPLTPFDPKNTSTQVFTYATNGSAVALARGFALDSLADKSGRRLRDGWSIGADSLDELTVARMRSVIVREVAGTKDVRGDGLGCIVREGDEESVPRDPADENRCLPVPSR